LYFNLLVLYFCSAKKFGFMYSQKRNCAASVPNFHIHMPVSVLLYIFPCSVRLFSCSRIGRPMRGIYSINISQKHECRNWDYSRAVPFTEHLFRNFGIVSLQCEHYHYFIVNPYEILRFHTFFLTLVKMIFRTTSLERG